MFSVKCDLEKLKLGSDSDKYLMYFFDTGIVTSALSLYIKRKTRSLVLKKIGNCCNIVKFAWTCKTMGKPSFKCRCKSMNKPIKNQVKILVLFEYMPAA